MSPDRDVVAEETVALRAEVKEALAAWGADIDDYELERDYFDKMDRLDINLAERGLERGEDIDEELPLREFSENALEASDAHRKAKELKSDYFHAETLAEDLWPHGGNPQESLDVFQDHLREHPELEALDEWKPYFHDMQASLERLQRSLDQSIDRSLDRDGRER
jgi:hypothetical protein